ncbi:MAG: PIN domain-containing protein [Candidatus Lokiarchaeota archaeon]|nr:PIN domain-containing protein [Candidatus Lokiarchaeota archaeon]
MQKICLDTGILNLYLANESPKKINELISRVKKGELQCYIIESVLVELYLNICKREGIEIARITTLSFIRDFPHILVNLDEDLIITAGKLKCQHQADLSHIDCMSIAFCLNTGITFHTTEKNLKKIPHNTLQRLKVVKYEY